MRDALWAVVRGAGGSRVECVVIVVKVGGGADVSGASPRWLCRSPGAGGSSRGQGRTTAGSMARPCCYNAFPSTIRFSLSTDSHSACRTNCCALTKQTRLRLTVSRFVQSPLHLNFEVGLNPVFHKIYFPNTLYR